MTDFSIDPSAPSLEFQPYPQEAPSACRSTRHCADHGWCHRCAPDFAETMSRVNVAIQHADPDASHWGPLYAAIGRALRGGEQPPRTTPNNPPTSGDAAEFAGGPTVREAAADDRRWFDGEKGGE